MRIPKPVLGGFLILLLLAAGAYFLFLNKAPAKPGNQAVAASGSDPGQSAAQTPGQKAPPAPLPVKAVKAIKGDLIITLKSPGEAYTREQVTLKAEVGGVVKTLYAAEGRHVKAGDLLFTIDRKPLEGQMRSAQAALEQGKAQELQAEANLRRDTANADYAHGLADRYAKAFAPAQK